MWRQWYHASWIAGLCWHIPFAQSVHSPSLLASSITMGSCGTFFLSLISWNPSTYIALWILCRLPGIHITMRNAVDPPTLPIYRPSQPSQITPLPISIVNCLLPLTASGNSCTWLASYHMLYILWVCGPWRSNTYIGDESSFNFLFPFWSTNLLLYWLQFLTAEDRWGILYILFLVPAVLDSSVT